MHKQKKFALVVAVVITSVFATQAEAVTNVIASHVGINNPSTETFSVGGSGGTLGGTNDSGTAAWRIDDDSGDYNYYAHYMTPAENIDAKELGWTMTATRI